MHVVLDWVGPVRDRIAILTLFTDDWGLARYACNYHAKVLVPTGGDDLHRAQAANLDINRVCLACWRSNRFLHLEDETHILIDCPACGPHGEELIMGLTATTFQQIADAQSSTDKLMAIFRASEAKDWEHIGKFLGRVRQKIRQNRREQERTAQHIQSHRLDFKKDGLRSSGRLVCRHGVFFSSPIGLKCPRMTDSTGLHPMWRKARWIPKLEPDTRIVMVQPFV